MTYKELAEQIDLISEERQTPTVYIDIQTTGCSYPIMCFGITTEDDVLDKNHPFLNCNPKPEYPDICPRYVNLKKIRQWIGTLTQEQANANVTVYDISRDEWIPVDRIIRVTDELEAHPQLVVDYIPMGPVCPKCGHDVFIGHQVQRHDVLCDGNGNWLKNLECYDSDAVYGFFACSKCGAEFDELPKE